MTALDNPADAKAVAMIRALKDALVAKPTQFTEWECGFIAIMWRHAHAETDGTPVFVGRRAALIKSLYARTTR